jgi:hypothetical protein
VPQVAFFVGAASAGVGGVGILLAWDRYDRGPDAADGLDIDGMGLYSWVAPATGARLVKLKTKSPVRIREEGCPESPAGSIGQDFFNRFEVKPGGTALASVADFTFDIFEESEPIYSAAAEGKTIKFELSDNSVLTDAVSIQERPTLQAWEDPLDGWARLINSQSPAKDLWRELMTPNQRLDFW